MNPLMFECLNTNRNKSTSMIGSFIYKAFYYYSLQSSSRKFLLVTAVLPPEPSAHVPVANAYAGNGFCTFSAPVAPRCRSYELLQRLLCSENKKWPKLLFLLDSCLREHTSCPARDLYGWLHATCVSRPRGASHVQQAQDP